ncbi:MAG: Sterol desaturase [Solimicrobium sp.]|nr:Sterol desaturase [Solimicrobium sp.]
MLAKIMTLSFMISFTFFLVIILGEIIFKRSFSNVEKILDKRSAIKRIFRNMGIGFTYRLIFIPFFIVPILHNLPINSYRFLFNSQNSVIHFLTGLIVFDFMNYFTHFLSHKVKFLWKFHVVHHLDQKVDISTGFRQHFGEKLLILPFKLSVIVLFNISPQEIFFIELISFCNGLFHHSNIYLNTKIEKYLCYIFTLPAFHVVHHCNKMPYIHSNYGFIFSWWDRIFRTVSTDSIYKVENPIFGVGKCNDASLLSLLLKPFYSRLPY